jgi:hypothetical protein
MVSKGLRVIEWGIENMKVSNRLGTRLGNRVIEGYGE